MKTFEIEASGVATVGSFTMKKVLISFDAEPSNVAEKLTAQEIVSALGTDALLEVIGEDKAKAYFGLVPESWLQQEITKLADSIA